MHGKYYLPTYRYITYHRTVHYGTVLGLGPGRWALGAGSRRENLILSASTETSYGQGTLDWIVREWEAPCCRPLTCGLGFREALKLPSLPVKQHSGVWSHTQIRIGTLWPTHSSPSEFPSPPPSTFCDQHSSPTKTPRAIAWFQRREEMACCVID